MTTSSKFSKRPSFFVDEADVYGEDMSDPNFINVVDYVSVHKGLNDSLFSPLESVKGIIEDEIPQSKWDKIVKEIRLVQLREVGEAVIKLKTEKAEEINELKKRNSYLEKQVEYIRKIMSTKAQEMGNYILDKAKELNDRIGLMEGEIRKTLEKKDSKLNNIKLERDSIVNKLTKEHEEKVNSIIEQKDMEIKSNMDEKELILKENLDAKDREIGDLKEKLEKEEKEVQNLKDTVEKIKKVNENMSLDIEKKDEEYKNLKIDLTKKETEVENLQSRLESETKAIIERKDMEIEATTRNKDDVIKKLESKIDSIQGAVVAYGLYTKNPKVKQLFDRFNNGNNKDYELLNYISDIFTEQDSFTDQEQLDKSQLIGFKKRVKAECEKILSDFRRDNIRYDDDDIIKYFDIVRDIIKECIAANDALTSDMKSRSTELDENIRDKKELTDILNGVMDQVGKLEKLVDITSDEHDQKFVFIRTRVKNISEKFLEKLRLAEDSVQKMKERESELKATEESLKNREVEINQKLQSRLYDEINLVEEKMKDFEKNQEQSKLHSSLIEQINSLKLSVDEKQREIDDLKSKIIKTKDSEIEKTEKEVEKLRRKVNEIDLKNRVEELEKENEELKIRLDELERLNIDEKEREQLLEANEFVRKEFCTLQEEMDKIKIELRDKDRELSEVTTENKKLNDDIIQLEKQFCDCRDLLQKKEEYVKELESKHGSLQEKIEQKKVENAKLSAEKDHDKKRINELEKSLDDAKLRSTELLESLNKANLSVVKLESRLEHHDLIKQQKDSLENANKDLETKYIEFKTENKLLTKQIDEKDKLICELSAKIDIINEKSAKSDKILSELYSKTEERPIEILELHIETEDDCPTFKPRDVILQEVENESVSDRNQRFVREAFYEANRIIKRLWNRIKEIQTETEGRMKKTHEKMSELKTKLKRMSGDSYIAPLEEHTVELIDDDEMSRLPNESEESRVQRIVSLCTSRAQSDISALESKVSAINKELTLAKQKSNEDDNSIRAMSEELGEVRDDNEELKKVIKDMEDQLMLICSSITRKPGSSRTKSEPGTGAKSLHSLVRSIQKELNHLTSQNRELESQFKIEKEKCDEAKVRLGENQTKIKDLQTEVKDLQDKNDKLNTTYEQYRENQRKKHEDLENELSKSRREIDELSSEKKSNSGLMERLKEKAKECNKYKEACNARQAKISQFEKEIAGLKKQLKIKEDELSVSDKYDHPKAWYDETIKRYQETIKELQQTVSKSEVSCIKNSDDFMKLSQQVKEHKRFLEDLAKRIGIELKGEPTFEELTSAISNASKEVNLLDNDSKKIYGRVNEVLNTFFQTVYKGKSPSIHVTKLSDFEHVNTELKKIRLKVASPSNIPVTDSVEFKTLENKYKKLAEQYTRLNQELESDDNVDYKKRCIQYRRIIREKTRDEKTIHNILFVALPSFEEYVSKSSSHLNIIRTFISKFPMIITDFAIRTITTGFWCKIDKNISDLQQRFDNIIHKYELIVTRFSSSSKVAGASEMLKKVTEGYEQTLRALFPPSFGLSPRSNQREIQNKIVKIQSLLRSIFPLIPNVQTPKYTHIYGYSYALRKFLSSSQYDDMGTDLSIDFSLSEIRDQPQAGILFDYEQKIQKLNEERKNSYARKYLIDVFCEMLGVQAKDYSEEAFEELIQALRDVVEISNGLKQQMKDIRQRFNELEKNVESSNLLESASTAIKQLRNAIIDF